MSKAKVKGTPVSAASSWLISLVFHIRASYRLLSLSFYGNRASHSQDTIWPWKFKGKGTPVSAASSWLISVEFHIRASYRLQSLSFHDNRASHSRDTIWPCKFKVKGQGQRYSSQGSIQLNHFLLFTPIRPTIPKILPKPVLINHQQDIVAFIREKNHQKCPWYPCCVFENLQFFTTATSPSGQWVINW